MRARIITVALLVVALSLLWIPVANAYIDPGSGSFVFQSLIGALLAVGFAIKVFWKRIVGVFKGRDHTGPND
jgi:hypothetical protein